LSVLLRQGSEYDVFCLIEPEKKGAYMIFKSIWQLINYDVWL